MFFYICIGLSIGFTVGNVIWFMQFKKMYQEMLNQQSIAMRKQNQYDAALHNLMKGK